ncbi:MAG TPA: ATP-binding protein [Candidatus Baltobacteraceae bacterium]|nr:ATP-binding protein [Candidatus Baltobacteraceae bacterium]
MKSRLRTGWLEIAAGFHLLFAAVAAYELKDAAVPFGLKIPYMSGVTLMLLAASAVFLLHTVRASGTIRRGLFFFAGAGAAAGAPWFFASGDFALAALQAGYASWLLAASVLPWCDPGIVATDEVRVEGFSLVAGAALGAIGVRGLLTGSAGAWHAPLMAGVSVVLGAAMLWTGFRGARRTRLASAALGAAAFLYHAVIAMQASDTGSAGALMAVFALLLLSVTVDGRLPEAADDFGGATPRQREIHVYERARELSLWVLVALSALFINFIPFFDARLYFAAILAIAFVTQYGNRLRPAAAISDQRYLLTMAAVIVASIVLISATGGVLGPFVYVAYLFVFAGMVIVNPGWSVAAASVYAAYAIAELVWKAVSHPEARGDLHVAAYLFLASTLLFAGLYTAWSGRRRIRTGEALLAANKRLAEALRNAVRERERYERQAQDLKSLNRNLLEMRSALMNVLEDVEESKRQIEVERRREVASFNALAEGVLAAGKDGKVFLCNPTAARIIGMPAEDVIGKPIDRVMRLFQEDGLVMQTRAFEDAFAGRTVTLGERLRLTRADGSHVPVSGNAAPYLDEENRTTGIVVAFRDVTVEREIDRQKSDFISIASHQLRTPLSALRWFLDLLLAGDAGPLKPTQREYLGDMSTSVARMIKLVGDLLNISRIESGRTKPVPERIETHAFVDSLVREFMPLVRQQEVAFTSSVAKDADVFYADPSLARQAVANIISNAVKYTPAGGSVSIEAKAEGPETVFKVKDTGLGIPKNQQYRIFDKFFRGENVVAQETVGSGLGLYVVKTIVDLSGGRIWFDSTEKKGTTFYLTFPNGPKALPAKTDGGTLSA